MDINSLMVQELGIGGVGCNFYPTTDYIRLLHIKFLVMTIVVLTRIIPVEESKGIFV